MGVSELFVIVMFIAMLAWSATRKSRNPTASLKPFEFSGAAPPGGRFGFTMNSYSQEQALIVLIATLAISSVFSTLLWAFQEIRQDQGYDYDFELYQTINTLIWFVELAVYGYICFTLKGRWRTIALVCALARIALFAYNHLRHMIS